jgi:hypothetical protein
LQPTEDKIQTEKKRGQNHSNNAPSPKKKKIKSQEINVSLPNAPLEGKIYNM